MTRIDSRLVPTAGVPSDPGMVALLGDLRLRSENGVSLLAPIGFAVTSELGVAGEPVAFRAVGAGLVSWRWDFGDGSTGEGERVTHAHARPGVRTVALSATDAEGARHTCSAPVLVVEGIDRARYSPGLRAEFFDLAASPAALPDLDALTADLERTDPRINYPKTTGGWRGLPDSMTDTFASRHTGYVKVDPPVTTPDSGRSRVRMAARLTRRRSGGNPAVRPALVA
ncbi:MAG: PKD domain-containing protein, partial [Planctomycetota bacterium]